MEGANWFTRFCCWLREFSITPYTPRFHVEELGTLQMYFKGYSEDRWCREFPESRKDSSGWSPGGYTGSAGAFGPPHRICASEEILREMAKEQQPPLPERQPFPVDFPRYSASRMKDFPFGMGEEDKRKFSDMGIFFDKYGKVTNIFSREYRVEQEHHGDNWTATIFREEEELVEVRTKVTDYECYCKVFWKGSAS